MGGPIADGLSGTLQQQGISVLGSVRTQGMIDAVAREAVNLAQTTEPHGQYAHFIGLDGVAQHGTLLHYALTEHIEHADVHPGNATLVLPPQKLTLEMLRHIKQHAKDLASSFHLSGAFHMQFLARKHEVRRTDYTLYPGRSLPFASKASGVNIARLATQALLGCAPAEGVYHTIDADHVAVRAPHHDFTHVQGADPRRGGVQTSTGEACCFGETEGQALLLALMATGMPIPKKNLLLSIGHLEHKTDLLPAIQALYHKGYSLFATHHTHEFLKARSIPSVLLYPCSEPRSPNVREYLERQRIDLLVSIPTHPEGSQTDGYQMRRQAADRGIPVLTNARLLKEWAEAVTSLSVEELPVLAWPGLLAGRQASARDIGLARIA
jgi:carbamoyl-phosphate synthase large subunit